MTREDFVEVKLTTKGEQVARGAEPPKDYKGPRSEPCLRISGGGYEFCFEPGAAQQVPRAQWGAILSKEERDGEPLLIMSELAGAKEE